jgi:hypothetical protein
VDDAVTGESCGMGGREAGVYSSRGFECQGHKDHGALLLRNRYFKSLTALHYLHCDERDEKSNGIFLFF